ncbi:hypothetical protein HS99_0039710 [Kitasatospora aureofaciens]|uniref:Uncharacterized protein n=1 Tax=Kitasatospora aureofaciens TaxID=1894 RepID=A0A1E7MWS1_KITAU|nr:hypothetical protein HS99_0039710 [Kitasatospora aureofaciens]
MNWDLIPRLLPWSAVDPDRHSFTWTSEEEELVTGEIRAMVPSGSPFSLSFDDFVNPVTDFLVGRYGRWACGWHWAVGEGGGGGVVQSWCCTSHSLREGPEATSAIVVASLLEWRDWLEELADRFVELAPAADANAEDRSWHVQRAATRLVTLAVDRTCAQDGWYGLCERVLTWYLSSAGLEGEEAAEIVTAAIGGRFKSWAVPGFTTVDAVAEDLAFGVTRHRPYRDH